MEHASSVIGRHEGEVRLRLPNQNVPASPRQHNSILVEMGFDCFLILKASLGIELVVQFR